MASVGSQSAYATDIIAVQRVYYSKSPYNFIELPAGLKIYKFQTRRMTSGTSGW